MITHSYYNLDNLFKEGFFLDEESNRYVWYRKKGLEPFEFFAGNDPSKIRKTVQLISCSKKEVSAMSPEKFDEIYKSAVMAEQKRKDVRNELEILASRI